MESISLYKDLIYWREANPTLTFCDMYGNLWYSRKADPEMYVTFTGM